MKTLKALKVELLSDKATQAEYDALVDGFDTAHELIAARAGLTQTEVAGLMGTAQSASACW